MIDLHTLAATTGFVFGAFLIALVATLLFELLVAALFKVGRRGLRTVAWINLLTNPIFNLAVVFVALTTGLGFGNGWIVAASVPVFEVVVVIVEWRLLVWTLHGTAGSSRKMLALSVAMNVASAFGGVLVWTALQSLGV